MFKQKFALLSLLLIALSVVIAACSNAEMEQALQQAEQQAVALATENADAINEAASQVEAAATANADEINAAATAAAEQLENAQGQAENAIASAQATANAVAAQATAAAAPQIDYDTEVYGVIDEVDLNGVVVNWWHQHRGGREEELIALVDEFNATNPYGIVVEPTNEGGYGDIYDKMIAGLTTGDVPSLVVAYQNQAAAYEVADGLISLDPYINHPTYGLTEEEQDDLFQSFLNQDRLPQFGGESFGFPPNRSMEVLYYNQTWLEELGYDGPPRTPAEFQEMACAATDEAEGTVGYEISTDASRFASFVFARGGDIYDYENNRFTFSTPEATAAMQMIQEMFDEGCAILIAEQYGDQADFAARRTLFTIGSSSGLPFYQSQVAESEQGTFEWSVAPIPYTGFEPAQNIYGASVSIPQTTPEEQLAAWLFIKYFTSTEAQARWSRVSNYFPVRESVADGLSDYFADNPAYETAFELLEYGKSEPPVAGYDNVRDEMSEAFSRIVQNGEDVETVLAELEEQANQILAESAPE